MFKLKRSGCGNSAYLRDSLAKYLQLPTDMSANAFLDCINAVFEYEEFFKAVELWRQEEDKN